MKPVYITVAYRCGHTGQKPIVVGTEATIRASAAAYDCQSCRDRREAADPRRYSAGQLRSMLSRNILTQEFPKSWCEELNEIDERAQKARYPMPRSL